MPSYWVIEADGPKYFTARTRVTCVGTISHFTFDPMEAVRFSRWEDADAIRINLLGFKGRDTRVVEVSTHEHA